MHVFVSGKVSPRSELVTPWDKEDKLSGYFRVCFCSGGLLVEPGRVQDGVVRVSLCFVVGLVPQGGTEFRQGFKLLRKVHVDVAAYHWNSRNANNC